MALYAQMIMDKKSIILVCGLNGVGKSTFAKALAKELGYRFIDIEDVYFSKQDNPNYPYEKSRSYDEVVSILNDVADKEENIVLASVTGHFGDEFISRIRCAIYIKVPRTIRLQRVRDRSYKLFGEKSCEGGEFYEQIKSFHTFCGSRDERLVDKWLSNISCPIIRVDGTLPIDMNVTLVADKFVEEIV